tara:strand:+ start:2574 stop:2696 length:123 start_codon:yes stop_codon:yes gene_type:complete
MFSTSEEGETIDVKYASIAFKLVTPKTQRRREAASTYPTP